MMSLYNIKSGLYWCGISLALSSIAQHYLSRLVDAQKATGIGHAGMWLSGGIMVQLSNG